LSRIQPVKPLSREKQQLIYPAKDRVRALRFLFFGQVDDRFVKGLTLPSVRFPDENPDQFTFRR